jgi:segregation and condensation protein B
LEVEDTLLEFESDLMGADRGVQVYRRASGIRLEIKPQFAGLIEMLFPERKAKPLSAQAHEVLGILALKPDVSINYINNTRGVESSGTIRTLSSRGLIARIARRGPNREKLWRVTPLFLETFNLSSTDELREPGRLEEVFPSIYSAELNDDEVAGGGQDL